MAPKDRPRSSSSSIPQARAIQISKALSWLLRHGAAKERIAIDGSGFVNLQDVLNWQKLKSIKAGFDEVIEVVQSNEKQRFGLKWNATDPNLLPRDETDSKIAQAKDETPHQLALAHIEASTSPDPKEYSIRAVQGHSLKTIEATSLLTPVTSENAPSTCVHGTFYTSWPTILKTGGLKAMTRNHVHFASGPRMEDVLPDEAPIEQAGRDGRLQQRDQRTGLKEAMRKGEVVSGMRGDAQVLIYVGVKRSIEEGQLEWWRSENGVFLTAGVDIGEAIKHEGMAQKVDAAGDELMDIHLNTQSDVRRPPQASKPQQKLVPMAYWDIVVGIDVGVLWERGKGIVREVPANIMTGGKKKLLATKGTQEKPQPKNRGKGSDKPKVMVERDDLDGFD